MKVCLAFRTAHPLAGDFGGHQYCHSSPIGYCHNCRNIRWPIRGRDIYCSVGHGFTSFSEERVMHSARGINAEQSTGPRSGTCKGVNGTVRHFYKITTPYVVGFAVHKKLEFTIKHIEALIFTGMVVGRCAGPRRRFDLDNSTSISCFAGKSMECQKISKKMINPRARFSHCSYSLYSKSNTIMIHKSTYETSVL